MKTNDLKIVATFLFVVIFIVMAFWSYNAPNKPEKVYLLLWFGYGTACGFLILALSEGKRK